MPDDDRSEIANAAKPSIVRSDDAPSSDPVVDPTPFRLRRLAPHRLTLLLTVVRQLARLGSARIAARPEPARLRTAARPGLTWLRTSGRWGAPYARRPVAWVTALATRAGLPERLGQHRSVRLGVAAGLLCCLGLIAAVGAAVRSGDPDGAGTAGSGDQVTLARPDQASGDDAPSRSADRDRSGSAGSTSDDPDGSGSEESAALADAAPVVGLSQVQMDNARAIVRTGRDMGMPRRAWVIGVATAMQESNLLNRASEVLPESKRYPHQGSGWDHDSVGLFQQRTSSGWGPVNRLMDPGYATARFFDALRRVPGWERMRLTEAAQAVQVSAYPEHYAKHEWQANEVVEALAPRWR